MAYHWKTICEVCEGTPEIGDRIIRVTDYAIQKSGWSKLGVNMYYCERCWRTQDVEQDLP